MWTVACRLRRPSPGLEESCLAGIEDARTIFVQSLLRPRSFDVGVAVDSSTGAAQLVDAVGQDAVARALRGEDTLFLAWGQAGTGKTELVFGEEGLVATLCARLLASPALAHASDTTLSLTAVEVAHDALRDLLSPAAAKAPALTDAAVRAAAQADARIPVVDRADGGLDLGAQLSRVCCKEAALLRRLVLAAQTRRAAGSHCVLTLAVEGGAGSAAGQPARLVIVDLAAAPATNARPARAADADGGSRALADAIQSLALASAERSARKRARLLEGARVHRGSPLLLRLLADPLRGRLATCLLLSLSPYRQHGHETLRLLRVAAAARALDFGPLRAEIGARVAAEARAEARAPELHAAPPAASPAGGDWASVATPPRPARARAAGAGDGGARSPPLSSAADGSSVGIVASSSPATMRLATPDSAASEAGARAELLATQRQLLAALRAHAADLRASLAAKDAQHARLLEAVREARESQRAALACAAARNLRLPRATPDGGGGAAAPAVVGAVSAAAAGGGQTGGGQLLASVQLVLNALTLNRFVAAAPPQLERATPPPPPPPSRRHAPASDHPDDAAAALAAAAEPRARASSGAPAPARTSPAARAGEASASSSSPSASRAVRVEPCVRCEGFLVKQGGLFPTWKRRYVRLEGRALAYSTSPAAAQPIRSVRFGPGSEVFEHADVDGGGGGADPLWFSCAPAGLDQRIFCFRAETPAQRARWVAALRAAAAAASSPDEPAASSRAGEARADGATTPELARA